MLIDFFKENVDLPCDKLCGECGRRPAEIVYRFDLRKGSKWVFFCKDCATSMAMGMLRDALVLRYTNVEHVNVLEAVGKVYGIIPETETARRVKW